MNANEARDEIKRRWRELWKADKEGKGVICPLCGSGNGAHGTGIREDTRKEGHFLKCFACGFAGGFHNAFAAGNRRRFS